MYQVEEGERARWIGGNESERNARPEEIRWSPSQSVDLRN